MIGMLRGKLVAKQPPQLMIDVNGVGYELDAPMSTFYELPAIGAEVTLRTHLVVREDAHILFGFINERERRMFRELLKVSNVGPKLALAILSGVSVEQFLLCVESSDVDSLIRIPGVGRKTAERLIIELRDRTKALSENSLGGSVLGGMSSVGVVANSAHAEATGALIALGYKPVEVVRLLKSVPPEATSTEDMIRHALKMASAKSS
jgi:holliday junction DNA helicase RuvA